MITRHIDPPFEFPEDLGPVIRERLNGKSFIAPVRPMAHLKPNRRKPGSSTATVVKKPGVVFPKKSTAIIDPSKQTKVAEEMLRSSPDVKLGDLTSAVSYWDQDVEKEILDLIPAIRAEVDGKMSKPNVSEVLQLCVRIRHRNSKLSLMDGDMEIEALARVLVEKKHTELALFVRRHFGTSFRGEVLSIHALLMDLDMLEASERKELADGN
jgi:hypothetical protein